MQKAQERCDVVVIGGGSAGMTAAIYTGRARLSTVLIEQSLPGGLATYTSEIENYSGFPESISGTELMKLFQKQAKKFGVKFKLTQVTSVDFRDTTKVVSTGRVDYLCKAVIVATGGKPRLTGAVGEDKFLYDKGISFCATCDAAYYTGKNVMVIGSGDAAIEEAMFLTKFADRVYISVIHDEGIVDANKVAQEKAFANDKLTFIWNTMVDEFRGGERLDTVVLRNLKTGEKIPVAVDGCFLFIGYIPNTGLFRGLLDLDERGYVVTNELMETNIPGVFACGDVRSKLLRQVATSVGDGAIAGFMVERYIADLEFLEERLLNKEGPVLVCCWDPTCAESREYSGWIEQFCRETKTELLKIDVYKNANLAVRLGLSGKPCVALFDTGRLKATLESYPPENVLKELVA